MRDARTMSPFAVRPSLDAGRLAKDAAVVVVYGVMASFYDIGVRTIDGASQPLAAYRGKTILVVNVASKCGFTPQYAGLEALYRKYKDRGLVVLGFPCNQFGSQEPGTEAEIQDFCATTYNVTFPLFAK